MVFCLGSLIGILLRVSFFPLLTSFPPAFCLLQSSMPLHLAEMKMDSEMRQLYFWISLPRKRGKFSLFPGCLLPSVSNAHFDQLLHVWNDRLSESHIRPNLSKCHLFWNYCLGSFHPKESRFSVRKPSSVLTLWSWPNLKAQIRHLNNGRMSLSHVQLFETPWTVALQAPLSMDFSRQEHWSGSPFPSPGNLPEPTIKPASPALQADSLPSEPPGKPSERWRC